MLSEEKLLELKRLSERTLETDLSRFGEFRIKSDIEMSKEFLERLSIPDLPALKLRKVLESFSQDELCELQALMWLGRDTFENCDLADGQQNFEDLYNEAKASYNAHDVDYIMGKSMVLAKYLLRGMIVIGVFENGRTTEL